MAFLSHKENVTKRSTMSHFLLMFGYKLFSLYFPLFLVMKGWSLPEVGFIYLLIYLPMVFVSPLIGVISHKVNPAILITAGILGYAIYSLGMLIGPSPLPFYLLQVLLGISASLFFVTNKEILMGANLEKPAGSFGWFYSAPLYASNSAPVIGAIIIFLWGFNGVFIASILIHLVNMIFTVFSFSKITDNSDFTTTKKSFTNFAVVFKKMTNQSIFGILAVTFSVVFVGGFYHAFSALFLKSIGWSQNAILFYLSVFSIVFLPFSLLGIRLLSSHKITNTILMGSVLFGIGSFLFGFSAGFIGFLGILVLMELQEFGSFIANSGRSGLFSNLFKSFSKEASSIDTVFSPLGTALGALVGGLLIGGGLSYSAIFIIGGIFILVLSFFSRHAFDTKY